MRTNWVERLWIDGPWRIPFQVRELNIFKRFYDLKGASRVLEIGCGRGVGALLILKHFNPAHIEAVDVDPSMIRRAERRITPEIEGRVIFRIDDAQDLSFPNHCMDAVFNFGIIHHLEDWERGIREVARVLVRGGIFYFEEIYPALYAGPVFRHILLHPKENRFDGQQYRAALAREGLSIIDGYLESKYTIIGAAIRAD